MTKTELQEKLVVELHKWFGDLGIAKSEFAENFMKHHAMPLIGEFHTQEVEPTGDAIEVKVNPEVMRHVVQKSKLKATTIAKRTLTPEWQVENWLSGTGDQYDYEVYIWKLKILADLSGRYSWAVFLIDDVSKLTPPAQQEKEPENETM